MSTSNVYPLKIDSWVSPRDNPVRILGPCDTRRVFGHESGRMCSPGENPDPPAPENPWDASQAGPHGGPPTSAGRSTGCRIQCRDLPAEARQDESPGDELDLGDDIAVGDPPRHRSVLLECERLDLGLGDHVRETG
jgi:hypothetical protein